MPASAAFVMNKVPPDGPTSSLPTREYMLYVFGQGDRRIVYALSFIAGGYSYYRCVLQGKWNTEWQEIGPSLLTSRLRYGSTSMIANNPGNWTYATCTFSPPLPKAPFVILQKSNGLSTENVYPSASTTSTFTWCCYLNPGTSSFAVTVNYLAIAF